MTYYNSRLVRRQQKITRRQAYFFFAGSLLLIIALVIFGLPALFSLTGTISSFNQNGDSNKSTNQSLAPTVPQLSQDFTATNTAQIKIEGFADAKTTIQLFHNASPDQTTITGDDGKFEFSVSLEKGSNTFQAQAVADSGNKSDKSAPYVVSYLQGNPKLDITSPKDGDSINASSVTITGQLDPGSTVAINDHLAIVDSNGNFQASVNLQNGDNLIKIVATDTAGNTISKQLQVKSTATP